MALAPTVFPDAHARRARIELCAWAVAAGLVPLLLAWIENRWLGDARVQSQLQEIPPLSLGECVGMILGTILGFRSRRLLGWMLGPTFGFMIGWLDVRIGYIIGGLGWLAPMTAAMVPVWGMLFGLALAAVCPSRGRALVILGAGIASDLCGRAMGAGFIVNCQYNSPDALPMWFADGFCFLPTCATLVLLAPKEWRGSQRNGNAREVEDALAPSCVFVPAIVAGIILLYADLRVEGLTGGEPDEWTYCGLSANPGQWHFRGNPAGIGLTRRAPEGIAWENFHTRILESFAEAGCALEDTSGDWELVAEPEYHSLGSLNCLWLNPQSHLGMMEPALGLDPAYSLEAVRQSYHARRVPDPAAVHILSFWHDCFRAERLGRMPDTWPLCDEVPDRSRRLGLRSALVLAFDRAGLRSTDETVREFVRAHTPGMNAAQIERGHTIPPAAQLLLGVGLAAVLVLLLQLALEFAKADAGRGRRRVVPA